jgi:hypothetical protein
MAPQAFHLVMTVARRRNRRSAKPASTFKDGIPIDAPNAPAEGSDAGDATDRNQRHIEENVRRLRAQADRHFQTARRLHAQRSPAAEAAARRAIHTAVEAFWWAEDSDLEDAQHAFLHRVGRWTRKRFGCWLDFDGQRYVQRCRIAIAHKRFGFSPGYTAILRCSICDEDLSECPHLPHRYYWIRGGNCPTGRCAVCHEKECRHRADRLYRTRLTSLVTDMEILEVSFVRRPAGVTTRLLELPISMDGLQETFGPEFTPGTRISCDQCLGDCLGFTELPDLGSSSSG